VEALSSRVMRAALCLCVLRALLVTNAWQGVGPGAAEKQIQFRNDYTFIVGEGVTSSFMLPYP
jgi:hypothetical protein